MAIPSANLAAWYRYGRGLTLSGSLVSQWDDASGNARNLVQATATNQPARQADGSILFDGVDNFMAATFTLDQPNTVYFLGRQITWTVGETIFDGVTANGLTLQQDKNGGGGASPNIVQYAGAYGGQDLTNMTLNVDHVISAVFNGASSLVQVDNNTAGTGNAGANNAGGFQLAFTTATAAYGHIQVKEVLIYSAAHDADTRSQVIGYLQTIQSPSENYRSYRRARGRR